MQKTKARQAVSQPGGRQGEPAVAAGAKVTCDNTDLEGDAYLAEINYDGPPHQLQCRCGGCAWTGTANELTCIDSFSLTPGDPSPAGRCPECDALAYLTQGPLERATELLREMLAYEAEKFDGTVVELNVSGADLVDWFTSFRQRVQQNVEGLDTGAADQRRLVGAAPPPATTATTGG